MKKIIALCLMAGLLLCAAASAEESVLPVFEWERDMLNHWKLDAEGQSVNVEKHQLDDSMICTVCGSEVWDWGGGYGSISNYDEYGNTVRYTSFDEDESLSYDSKHALTYDENGVLVLDLEYINGILYNESVYHADAHGCSIPVKSTSFNDDGTTSVNEYDENGNCIRSAVLYEDGIVGAETLTEYKLTEDGWYYEARTIDRFDTGEEVISIYNQYGDKISYVYTEADGTVIMNYTDEFEYEDGVRRYNKTYSFGVLVSENFYDEEGCTVKMIDYEEDGIYHVTTYDEDEEPVTVTYNAAGEIVQE